ncbi:PTS fructose transporter subunit IIC [Streptococcus pantholopis]|uniref:PTS fructose transporter subunit IIC n=1 Tax=Streptococcus pantholopis TaxID=1811193 RepID=A0A172Q589_9STRE|nr:fructose-specific PTS transporter subunit EIIC [Streptococcus pantholopis]AND78620.1 PTS fructose transporter subunit IIC [Streptococcus pantholopis]
MSTYQLVAATGCPTGIAHTFMAQEALEKAAKKRGISIKVETHGQVGVENALTSAEIASADAVIIAADKDVQAERFAGKRVISVPVADGIRKADQLIADALSGKGSIQGGSAVKTEAVQQTAGRGQESVGHQIYKHLMNGVSRMLPFVVAGGVLVAVSFLFGIYSSDPQNSQYNWFAALLNTDIGAVAMGMMTPVLAAFIAESIAKRSGFAAGMVGGLMAVNGGSGFLGGIIAGFTAGYIVLALEKILVFLPKSLDGLKAIFLYPVFGVLFTGLIMSLINAPMAWVNESLMAWLAAFENANPLILGVIIGCMSAFDMGGPVNKAAYVTGTALLAQGNTTFMAGVSAACIAPPLTTFVATTVFRKYYSEEDRNAGMANLILGSTHITEGAIPFAAKDPLRILPTLMLGSSIAAVLTYMWDVQVPAPHGGFLVLPVVTHAFLWVLAIAIGSITAGLIMGLIEKNKAGKASSA